MAGNLAEPLTSVASSMAVESGHRRLGIGCKQAGLLDVLAVQDILAHRLRQCLAALRQRQVIGRRPAIEGLAEGLHALRHLEVADPHLAQIIVHIVAKMVEQPLRQGRAALHRLQAAQEQPQMQQKQVKTAVNRVRNPKVPIKQRFSRLRHDHAIDGLDGAAQRRPGFPEVIERPKHCGFRKRALQLLARRPRVLQSSVLPGTSTHRAMQEDGLIPEMTEMSHLSTCVPSPRRLTVRRRGFRAAAAVALICAALAGCTGEQFQKGYILPPNALEQIPIGASQDQVLIVMGTPSTVATLNGEVFYYISQRSERKVAFMNQQVVDQRVIAIYFDKNRQVQRLANYGLQDGKIFDFISRTTPTSGQELSYLTPLFKLLSFN